MAGTKVVLTNYGSTPEDAISRYLRSDSMPFPDPGLLKPTDLVIAVKCSNVAFIDTIMMTGQYQHTIAPPYVPGLEFSGEVAWKGREVTSFKEGDSILSDFMAVGPRSKGDYQTSGGWASYAVVPQEGVVHLPAGLDWASGCNLLINYETPYFALVNRAQLRSGETVLITGASGAAGMAAVQIAKQLGARVIVTGRSAKKLAEVKANGADYVIDTTAAVDESGAAAFRTKLKDLTDGNGVDVVYDSVGGDIGFEAFRGLAFGGRFVIVGWASNVSDQDGRAGFVPDRLPTNIMQMKALQVMGSPMAIYAARHPQWRETQKATILDWAAQGRIRPQVSHRFSINDYEDALRAKMAGEVTGGCVLTM